MIRVIGIIGSGGIIGKDRDCDESYWDYEGKMCSVFSIRLLHLDPMNSGAPFRFELF